MKFTIGTVSNIQEFEQDIKLIKASLLYADEIELIGMTEYAIFKYLPNLLSSEKDLEELISGIIPFLRSLNIPDKDEAIKQLEYAQQQLKLYAPAIHKKKRRSKEEILAQINIAKKRQAIQGQLDNTLRGLITKPCSHELEELLQKGYISIFDYQLQGVSSNELTGGYIGGLFNSIYSSNTFPLFDDASKKVLNSFSKTNLLDFSNLHAEVIRHAGVATNILMTLPTLNNARYDELLNLKKENMAALSRFRQAVFSFSEQISSMPWNDDFQYECIKLYNTQVLPQVEEINEIMTETSTLKNLGKKVLEDEEIRKKAAFAIGGLVTSITTSNSFSAFISKIIITMALSAFTAVEGASAFLKAINMAVKSYDESKESTKSGKKNVMYYYYLASNI